jgi:phospholipid/cholesterol/gamma-HCH transport system substrate-binding protein
MSQNLKDLSKLLRSALDQENRDLLRSLLQDLKDVAHTLSTHSVKLGSLLSHTEKITGTLANNSQRLETILINTEQASFHFEPLLKTTQGMLKMIESQTLPAASQTLMNITSTSSTLTNLIDEIKQDPSVLIRGKACPTPGPGEAR